MKPFGKMSNGKMRIQLIANLNVVFKYMKTTSIRLNLVGNAASFLIRTLLI